MDFKIKNIVIIALFAFNIKTAQSQSLIFQKAFTLQKTWCDGLNNSCGSVSGYTYPKSDTVPKGKIWKIQYIGRSGGDLNPHLFINNKEINSWDASLHWTSNQPIWLNEGDIISTGSSIRQWVNGSNIFMVISLNIIEFSKQ